MMLIGNAWVWIVQGALTVYDLFVSVYSHGFSSVSVSFYGTDNS